MKLGLVSDIHADAASLERAFVLLERRGADRVVCMGDLVDKGPDGDRVVAMLQWHLVPAVQGNHDAAAVERARSPEEVRDSDEALAPETIAALAALPGQREYQWDGVRVLLAHGTPGDANTYVFPDAIPKRFRRTLRTLPVDLLLLGHTHQPMVTTVGALTIVNPGSVTGSRTRDSHSCAVVDLASLRVSFYALDDGGEFAVAPRQFGAPDSDAAS
jgi:putative phosphoesterase